MAITETVFSTYTETETTITHTVTASDPSLSAFPVTSEPQLSSSSSSTPTGSADPSNESAIGTGAVLFLPASADFPASTTANPDTATAAPGPPMESPAPTESSPPSVPTGITAVSAPRPLVMAYYPDWAGSDFPPEKIDFNRIDWIDFAFAVPDQNFNLGWDGSQDAPDLLNRLVTAAHASGKKVKLSIGGWTGSK